jgi:hypothetical protein
MGAGGLHFWTPNLFENAIKTKRSAVILHRYILLQNSVILYLWRPTLSLSWLALTITPGIAARLSARLLNEFGTPENVFRASLTSLEACNLPAPVAQAIFKKQTF